MGQNIFDEFRNLVIGGKGGLIMRLNKLLDTDKFDYIALNLGESDIKELKKDILDCAKRIIEGLDDRIEKLSESENNFLQLIPAIKYLTGVSLSKGIEPQTSNCYKKMKELTNKNSGNYFLPMLQCLCAVSIIFNKIEVKNDVNIISYYFDIKSKFRIRQRYDLITNFQLIAATMLISYFSSPKYIEFSESLYDDIVLLSNSAKSESILEMNARCAIILRNYFKKNDEEKYKLYNSDAEEIIKNMSDGPLKEKWINLLMEKE